MGEGGGRGGGIPLMDAEMLIVLLQRGQLMIAGTGGFKFYPSYLCASESAFLPFPLMEAWRATVRQPCIDNKSLSYHGLRMNSTVVWITKWKRVGGELKGIFKNKKGKNIKLKLWSQKDTGVWLFYIWKISEKEKSVP